MAKKPGGRDTPQKYYPIETIAWMFVFLALVVAMLLKFTLSIDDADTHFHPGLASARLEYTDCVESHVHDAQCGRASLPIVASRSDALALYRLADGMFNLTGGGNGPVSIFDPISGVLSFGDKFVDGYATLRGSAQKSKVPFSDALDAIMPPASVTTFIKIVERLRGTVAAAFGVQPDELYLTTPCFFSRIEGGRPTRSENDEYYHIHVDTEQYPNFDFTALVYLSDSVEHAAEPDAHLPGVWGDLDGQCLDVPRPPVSSRRGGAAALEAHRANGGTAPASGPSSSTYASSAPRASSGKSSPPSAASSASSPPSAASSASSPPPEEVPVFSGGEFVFFQSGTATTTPDTLAGENATVRSDPSLSQWSRVAMSINPRAGSSVFFSSGRENPHAVRAVSGGVRYAVTIPFAWSPAGDTSADGDASGGGGGGRGGVVREHAFLGPFMHFGGPFLQSLE